MIGEGIKDDENDEREGGKMMGEGEGRIGNDGRGGGGNGR